MRVDFAARSIPGGREYNEDFYGQAQALGGWVFVTADGLGGHRGGAQASRLAVHAILDTFRNQSSISSADELLRLAIQNAQIAICKEVEKAPELSRMKTTVVILFLLQGRAYWAHIGDSRLYHFRPDGTFTHTRDHSVVQMRVDLGEITESEMRHDEDRNRLTRSLGAKDDLKPTIQAEGVPVSHGDYFLLCSDGFWESVTEEQMKRTINALLEPDRKSVV